MIDRRNFLCTTVGSTIALLSARLGMSATTAPTTRKVPKIVVDDPAVVPDRIVASLAGDPSTGFSASWHTGQPLAAPQAEIMLSSPNPKSGNKITAVQGTAIVAEVGAGQQAHYSRVLFQDLKPDTAYAYRVGDGKVWSEWIDIKTAAEGSAPFRFLYLGDEQDNIKAQWSRAVRAAFAHASDVDLIVHAGDMVFSGYSDALWDQWNYAASFIPSMRFNLATVGNHDTHRPPDSPQPLGEVTAAPLWHAQFALPENGPEGIEALKGEAYYADYQNVRFICLNTNVYEGGKGAKAEELAAAQTAWLEKVLSDNPCRWTIMLHHHPVFAVGTPATVLKPRDNKKLRDTLSRLYDKYAVDLVLQGHDHHYARTQKVAGQKVVDPAAKGAVYCVSVSGPKLYKANPNHRHLMARMLGDTQMFQEISVDNDRLLYKAFSIDGMLQDSFELRKAVNGDTVLKNLTPVDISVTQPASQGVNKAIAS